MEYVVSGRHPASVFRYFEDICAIPHGSYNEAGVADYLERFAAAHGLECYRDSAHNVLIKAPASPGMETRPPLLLQGHTDMVCEKNGDVEHDFLKDPLKLYTEGKFLRARGTTLGGDDGIAVAMMLSLLSGEVEKHPAYECLFTTAEEVGLDGAHAFDYTQIRSRRMLNLDSEELGVVTSGCAGGVRSDLCLTFKPIPVTGQCIRLQIKGLMGGHSGENINSGRANANKLLGRLLGALLCEQEFSIVSLQGGSKDNAIPRESEAILAVPNAETAMELLTEEAAKITQELCALDRGFTLTCESCEEGCVMMSAAESRKAVTLINSVGNGVLAMSQAISGLVEFSRNLGVMRFEEGQLDLVFSSRSSIEAQLDASIRELTLLGELCGFASRHYSRYPGWSYAEHSPLRDAYLATYRSVTGNGADVNVIHAGLECGVIKSHLPDMDMISIGPSMQNIHSPDEALDLDSVEVFWCVLETLIPKL